MTSIYVTSFNAPEQFACMIQSLAEYDSHFITRTKKFLINNSTDDSFDSYQELCDQWGFTHLKFDNVGIMGARLVVAQHFDRSPSQYYIYFEDDMLLSREGQCSMGFSRWCPQLFQKSVEIMEKEDYDFLKLNFTEVQISNDYDYVKSLEKSNVSIAGKKQLVKADFHHLHSHKSLPYANGKVYLSNWPVIMSKRGNWQCYLEKNMSGLLEHEISRRVHQDITSGKTKSAVLLLSPIDHRRIQSYSDTRKEY
jgi:hypothetical protein